MVLHRGEAWRGRGLDQGARRRVVAGILILVLFTRSVHCVLVTFAADIGSAQHPKLGHSLNPLGRVLVIHGQYATQTPLAPVWRVSSPRPRCGPSSFSNPCRIRTLCRAWYGEWYRLTCRGSMDSRRLLPGSVRIIWTPKLSRHLNHPFSRSISTYNLSLVALGTRTPQRTPPHTLQPPSMFDEIETARLPLRCQLRPLCRPVSIRNFGSGAGADQMSCMLWRAPNPKLFLSDNRFTIFRSA